MSSSALEKLTFTVLLLDKISESAKGVCKSIEKMQNILRIGSQNLGNGIPDITAVAIGLNSLTGRARDFNRALDEVGSLDASAEELNKLGKVSKKFTMQFGGNAAEIARSAYDVQSAIPGLAKGALTAFTYQANLLAKAGKATSGQVTEFFGTMYNIFETDAKKIGEGKWIEQLTGKMAYAVKMYKTTMPGMAAAFSNLGSAGKVSGISMDEQTAFLESLQGSMSGANAETADKIFLSQIANTSGVLGLSFLDSNKKQLPMPQSLEKICPAVDLGELKLADQTKLMQAFGEMGGKAVLNLVEKTEYLKGSIGDLSKVTDSNVAVKMAESMVDPYEQLMVTINVLQTSLKQTLFPVFNVCLKIVSKIVYGFLALYENCWILRVALGTVAIAVSIAVVAFRSLFAVFEFVKKIRTFWMELRSVYAWCLKNAAVTHSMTMAQRVNAIVQMLWQKSIGKTVIGQKLAALWTLVSASAVEFWTFVTSKATVAEKLKVMWSWICTKAEIAKTIALNAGIGAMLISSMLISKLAIGEKIAAVASWIMCGGLWAAATAAWAFTVALLANPITWIVLGIVALIGGLVALIYYWDEACNLCVKFADNILLMLGPIGLVIAAFRNWDKITVFLSNLWAMFKKVCPNIANLIEKLVAIVWAGIKAPFEWIWESIKQLGALFVWLGSMIAAPFKLCYEWLSDKLVPVIQFFSGLLEKMQAFLGSLFSWISDFGGAIFKSVIGIFTGLDGWIGSILRKISKIPGFGFLDPDVAADGTTKALKSVSKIETSAGAVPENSAMESVMKIENSANPDLLPSPSSASMREIAVFPEVIAARKQNDVAAGGIRTTQTTTKNYGGINIVAPNGISPAQLDEWLLLQGN